MSILEDLAKVDSVSIDVFKKKINPDRAREKGLKHLSEIKKRLHSAKNEVDSIPRPESSHPRMVKLVKNLADDLSLREKDASQILRETKELLLAAIRGEGDIPSRVKKKNYTLIIIALKSDNQFNKKIFRDKKVPDYYLNKSMIAVNNALIALWAFRRNPKFDARSQSAFMNKLGFHAAELLIHSNNGSTLSDALIGKIFSRQRGGEAYKNAAANIMFSYKRSFDLEGQIAGLLKTLTSQLPNFVRNEAVYLSQIESTTQKIRAREKERAKTENARNSALMVVLKNK